MEVKMFYRKLFIENITRLLREIAQSNLAKEIENGENKKWVRGKDTHAHTGKKRKKEKKKEDGYYCINGGIRGMKLYFFLSSIYVCIYIYILVFQ